jgi:hypothetical protein
MTRMLAVTRHESPVAAKLKKVESTAANESLVPEYFSREEMMIAEYPSCPVPERRDAPDRRLRSRIIVANVIAWIAIIAMIRLIFFKEVGAHASRIASAHD